MEAISSRHPTLQVYNLPLQWEIIKNERSKNNDVISPVGGRETNE
jgi:hypothetical protein